jgi:hypothetical protein
MVACGEWFDVSVEVPSQELPTPKPTSTIAIREGAG